MTDTDRLDAIAATQIIGDDEVVHCWALVREGVQSGKLGLRNLEKIVERLRAGNGMWMDDFGIEIESRDSGRAVVVLRDERRFCPVLALVAELERLLDRASGKDSGVPWSSSPGGAPPPVGVASGSQSASEPDLLGVVADLLGTTTAHLAGDPDAYRAQVERVRAATAALADAVRDPASDEATRAAAAARLRHVLAESGRAGDATMRARMADVAGTMAALGIDFDRFANALRTVADWLEVRTPAAGAAVDRMIAALEEAAGPLLGGADRTTRDAERDTRARDAARAAIAARLGKRSV